MNFRGTPIFVCYCNSYQFDIINLLPDNFHVITYRALEDPGVAPTVSISSPSEGDTVIQGTQLAISAQAADDVAVAAVIFGVNGTDVFADTTAPYEATYTVPLNAANLTISADAVDLAGNQAVSPAVNVTVIPDPLTTAIGTVADQNGVAIANAKVTCLGIEAISDKDGSFTISGLSTIQGDFLCTATFDDGYKNYLGSSIAVAPVRGRNTEMGKIMLLSGGRSTGRDFWLAYQRSGNGAQLIVLADTAANFTVTAAGFSYTGSVTPQSPAQVPIPSSLMIYKSQAIEDMGIHITSDADIAVLWALASEMALLVPTDALGMEYLAIGNASDASNLEPSEFVLVATQDHTNISINLDLYGFGSGTIPINVTLNTGQAYQYTSWQYQTDISGTRIISNKPFGVIAGAVSAKVPKTTLYANILSEMMLPVETMYGTEFFSAPLPGKSSDFLKIYSLLDNTTVTVDQGVKSDTYNSDNYNGHIELMIEPGTHITSNQPISVTQFATGKGLSGLDGPFQMQIIPTNAYKNKFRFYTLSNYSKGTYAIITAPNAAVPSVTLNGQMVTGFQTLPGGTYQYVLVTVPIGQSVVASENPIAVYGIGYGIGRSYGYPAGL